ncbi:hypothetical protein PsorP6_013718 [Peronosclerospora sorghi]|uniref:Uncharacterized protein n=1 Tax=Peronosclerospora sorghi TaxID=230839 RepID=A0ACC0VFP5_9STRA|nr:hypothetical protein PsorP6_013718 [Peronosclerospora sorghi]
MSAPSLPHSLETPAPPRNPAIRTKDCSFAWSQSTGSVAFSHLSSHECWSIPIFYLNKKMISSLNDKSALVLELGARYARCGVSGERAPRYVERWQLGEMLESPRDAGEWHRFLYEKLHTLCYNRLLMNPTRRQFVVCEDLLLPRMFRETLLSLIFDVFKASSVTLVPSMLTVLYATANHTALVVDCGWAETRLLPVYKGIPLPSLYETIPSGSRSCCEVIQQELNGSLDQLMDSCRSDMQVTEVMAEDILERACFAQQKDLLLHVVDAEFQMHDNDVLKVPGDLRYGAVEQLILVFATFPQWEMHFKRNFVLHEPGVNAKNGTSIVDGIVQVLKKCPLDIRAAMMENMLFVGGTAMIPGKLDVINKFSGFVARSITYALLGLTQRLVAEVRDALCKDDAFASASVALDRVQLVQTYFPPNMLGWVGGSIYAASDDARMSAISSQEYSSSKGTCIPDWLTVADEGC